jgi:hypothetical protein
MLPLIGGTPRPFLPDSAVTVSWSPDATRVVYHLQDDGDSTFVADRTGANARLIVRRSANEHNHFPIWSTDGRWIYYTSGTPETNEMDIWRVSPDGGSPERLTQHNAVVAYPTPIDGNTLLYVANDEDGSGPWLWALDVTRKLTRRLSFDVEKYMSVSSTLDATVSSARSQIQRPACGALLSSTIVWPRTPTSNLSDCQRRNRVHRGSGQTRCSTSRRSAPVTAYGDSMTRSRSRSRREPTDQCSRRRTFRATASD